MLALVLETDGSTYAGAGDMVLFCNGGQVGWLSGGCLEPELARRAEQVSAAGRVDWIEIDTRSDDDLLSGSALGCRGRLRIALLPLRAMAGIDDVIEAWLREGVSLQRDLRTSGQVIFRAGHHEQAWQLHTMDGTQPFGEGAWRLPLPRLPRALVLGAVPKRPLWFRCCGAWVAGQRGRTASALGLSRAVRRCAYSGQPGRGPSWRPVRRGTGDASRFRTGPGGAGGPG